MAVEETWRYVLTIDGREIELSDGEVTLGRSRTATVRVDHESVSRSHAMLSFRKGEAIVKDLNSSNGTYVGGRRVINETHLSNGDKLQLGAAVVLYKMVAPSTMEPSERTKLINEEMSGSAPPPDDGPSPGSAAEPAAMPPPVPPLEISAGDLFRGVDSSAKAEPPIGVVAAAALQAVRASSGSPAPSSAAAAAPPVVLDLRRAPEPVAAPAPPPIPPPVPAPRPQPAKTVAEERDISRVPLSIPSSEEERGTRAGVPDRAANAPPANLASVPQRFLALLVDGVILTALDLILMSPVFLILFLQLPREWTFWGITLLSYLVILAANFWYTVGGWAKSGRTPGKALVGLVVVAQEPRESPGLGWRIALLRALGYVVSGAVFGVGFLVALFRKDRRTWHDLIAGTWVISTR